MKTFLLVFACIVTMFVMASCEKAEPVEHVQFRAQNIDNNRIVAAYATVVNSVYVEGDTVIINRNGDIVDVPYDNIHLQRAVLRYRYSTSVKRLIK